MVLEETEWKLPLVFVVEGSTDIIITIMISTEFNHGFFFV